MAASFCAHANASWRQLAVDLYGVAIVPLAGIVAADDFHDPAVDVSQDPRGEAVAAGVLAEGNGAAGGVQQS